MKNFTLVNSLDSSKKISSPLAQRKPRYIPKSIEKITTRKVLKIIEPLSLPNITSFFYHMERGFKT